MKITSGLNKQIFLAIAIAGLLPLLVMAFQNNYFAREVIKDVEQEHLSFALRSRLLWLRTWGSHIRRDFYHIAFDHTESGDRSENAGFERSAKKLFKGHITYRTISLYRPDWSLLDRFPKGFSKQIHAPDMAYRTRLGSPGDLFILGKEYRDEAQDTILPVGQPLLNKKGDIGAFLIAEINLSQSLHRILSDTSDLNSGGRYILASTSGKILYQDGNSTQCKTHVIPADILNSSPWLVEKRSNCAGHEVYSVNAPIPEFNWILISQFDTRNVLDQFEKYIVYGLLTALGTLIIVIIIAQNLSKKLAAPLDELTRVARQISAGHHEERVPTFKEPYVQEVGIAFNGMIDALEQQGQIMIQNTTLSTLGKMSSSLVHEMRNPLSSIKINLQALSKKVKNDKGYAEMAGISLMQVGRLESMFDDLLRFSKPLDIHKEPLFFNDLIEEVLTSMAPAAEEKDISLKVKNNLQDLSFNADRKNSCRALINLISNAIQWSENGSTVTISGNRGSSADGLAIIRIIDQGPGLRPEQMDRLFQPFFTTRKYGTGLGLANVKKVMDYQGGSVLAENGIDRGAVFSLIFKD